MKYVYYGYNPPFFGGTQNVMSWQSGDRMIKNDLRQLLLTSPGERVYRPTFGSPIKGALFESLNQNDLPTLRDGIITAINTHEQRVRINDVKLQLLEDENTLNIVVDVSPNDRPATNFLVELNLSVGA